MEKNPIRLVEFLTLCLAALVSLFATGCDRNDLFRLYGSSRDSFMQAKTPRRQECFAKHTAELLRQGRYDEVVLTLQPGVVGADTHQSLVAMHDIFAEGEPASIKVIDAQKFHDGDAEITEIMLDYEFPSAANETSGSTGRIPARWVFVTFEIRSSNAASDLIDRINVVTSDLPIEDINGFTFENKGISQYAALATGISLWAFTIYSAVVCIRSKIGLQKWLWILFMLFTVTLASVNWTSGKWSFNRISFGFGVPPIPANLSFSSAYGPWSLTLGLPIGAIAFVLYRRFT